MLRGARVDKPRRQIPPRKGQRPAYRIVFDIIDLAVDQGFRLTLPALILKPCENFQFVAERGTPVGGAQARAAISKPRALYETCPPRK